MSRLPVLKPKQKQLPHFILRLATLGSTTCLLLLLSSFVQVVQSSSNHQNKGTGIKKTINNHHPRSNDHLYPNDLEIRVGPLFAQAGDDFQLMCPLSEETIKPIRLGNRFIKQELEEMRQNLINNVRVTWLKRLNKDNKQVDERIHRENGNHIRGLDANLSDDQIITLEKVGNSDNGRYLCNLTWPPMKERKYFFLPRSIVFSLQVEHDLPDMKPVISHGPPVEMIKKKGDNITFNCKSIPTLLTSSTFWFKSCPDEPLNTTCIELFQAAYEKASSKSQPFYLNDYMISNAKGKFEFHITNFSEKDAGYYGCAVYNRRGIDIRSCKLQLQNDNQITLASSQANQSKFPYFHYMYYVIVILIVYVIYNICTFLGSGPINSCVFSKKTNPLISSSDTNSDEACCGKSNSSHASDTCRTHYQPPSNATTITMPYDIPPCAGLLQSKLRETIERNASCVVNPMYGRVSLPSNCDWSFSRENLKFIRKLGEGQFGEVWETSVLQDCGQSFIVAVKKLKDRIRESEKENEDFMREIEIMKLVNEHKNVIKFLHGSIDKGQPLLLIMELAQHGSLQLHLKHFCFKGFTREITAGALIKYAHDIAEGMVYIASKNIVHRDLASRNILLGSDGHCKIGDFGMARNMTDKGGIYERTSENTKIPIRWMAPEVFLQNTFTTKSDVFSFGILLWEIVTLGLTPYHHLETNQVIKAVAENGERPARPDYCHSKFYNLMSRCWDHDPKLRPMFSELVNCLDALFVNANEYIELDHYPDHNYYNVPKTTPFELI